MELVTRYDVVIRCKNEGIWLERVLLSILAQNITPSKIVLVDDQSTDNSVFIAEKYGCEIVRYPDTTFNYSKALNEGLARVDVSHALILSAHCVLYNERSVEYLFKALAETGCVAGFGRQLPTPSSSSVDVRDLLTVFGRERLVFTKFPFFHNAFSLITMTEWKRNIFPETVNGIEDRVWAKDLCDRGEKIVYEPQALAYNEHGLNQSLDLERANRVCSQLMQLHFDDEPLFKLGSFLDS